MPPSLRSEVENHTFLKDTVLKQYVQNAYMDLDTRTSCSSLFWGHIPGVLDLILAMYFGVIPDCAPEIESGLLCAKHAPKPVRLSL